MQKTLFTLLVVVMTLAPGFVCMDDIQLFHYIHPSHEEQVQYILGIATYMMEKREWNRKFEVEEEKCPQFTTTVCPSGSICKPPTAPPKQPPNVCDLPDYQASAQCGPGGSCFDDGTCPVKVCEVPFELRRIQYDENGVELPMRLCSPGECENVSPKPADCNPVTRCDLKLYEGHLNAEECKNPDPCDVNPNNCINICDLSGDYSPCGYMDCYKMPFLPYCPKLPPPPPCPVDSTKLASDNTCCIGRDCFTAFDRCLWGRNVGVRVVEALNFKSFSNDSSLDANGNPVLQCVTKFDKIEKQPLMFECFKDGVLATGFELVNEADIDSIISENQKEGDTVVVDGSIDDKKMTVNMTNTKEMSVDGALTG